ncbi:MAG: LamG-like jellyroll fold domain-containing protein [Patescibacteria group bacterium]
MYVNGVESGSATLAAKTPAATQFALGSDPIGLSSRQFQGYMDDFRITKGVARYLSAFTPPSAIPSSGGVSSAVDQKGATVTTNGDAKISSVQNKFG